MILVEVEDIRTDYADGAIDVIAIEIAGHRGTQPPA
jgi:hypothetical protein